MILLTYSLTSPHKKSNHLVPTVSFQCMFILGIAQYSAARAPQH